MPCTLGVVPPQPPQLFSIRVYRAHPPKYPQGWFCCSLLPSQFGLNGEFHSKPQLRWIRVGLWVLAACAGRSSRSTGFQPTTRLGSPVTAGPGRPRKAKTTSMCVSGNLARRLPRNVPAWGIRVLGNFQVAPRTPGPTQKSSVDDSGAGLGSYMYRADARSV